MVLVEPLCFLKGLLGPHQQGFAVLVGRRAMLWFRFQQSVRQQLRELAEKATPIGVEGGSAILFSSAKVFVVPLLLRPLLLLLSSSSSSCSS